VQCPPAHYLLRARGPLRRPTAQRLLCSSAAIPIGRAATPLVASLPGGSIEVITGLDVQRQDRGAHPPRQARLVRAAAGPGLQAPHRRSLRQDTASSRHAAAVRALARGSRRWPWRLEREPRAARRGRHRRSSPSTRRSSSTRHRRRGAGASRTCGLRVIVAGLDQDYLGRPFPPDARAHGSGRARHEGPRRLHRVRRPRPAAHSGWWPRPSPCCVGGSETYEARCRDVLRGEGDREVARAARVSCGRSSRRSDR
jgi:hypothetical protein